MCINAYLRMKKNDKEKHTAKCMGHEQEITAVQIVLKKYPLPLIKE